MKDLARLFWKLIIGKGVNLASEDTFKKRTSICRANTCGEYKNPLKLGFLEKCGSCGCFLRTKNRIDEFFIKCPKNLW